MEAHAAVGIGSSASRVACEQSMSASARVSAELCARCVLEVT
jgi:hypothetical protein